MTRSFPLAFALSAAILPGAVRAGDPIEFNRDIRPILSENCFSCHGPDKAHRKAGLRLDRRDDAIAKGAIVPGQGEASEVLARIASDDPAEAMPPPESNKILTASQKDLLRRWVDEGAGYQSHWAYEPIRRPALPAVKSPGWARNPVDTFILSALEGRGLRPSPEADRRTLLRRLSLDLVGLPPPVGEVRAFVEDGSPDAYERAVDRLLASPHYGERMALPWLDLARYADSAGYHGDQDQNIFPYRDYVIDAFNRNLPFDRFTAEQLAGDLLPGPARDRVVATGFNRLNMMTREDGAQAGEYLAKYASDRVRTVSNAWLGSTVGCAECHDHKFDPFTSRDFYRLAAFFADVKQWGIYMDFRYQPIPEYEWYSDHSAFPPEISVGSPYLERRLGILDGRIRDLLAEAGARVLAEPSERARFEEWSGSIRSFLRGSPSGWMAPPASVSTELAGKVESVPISPDGGFPMAFQSGEAHPTSKGVTSVALGGEMAVASIRLELLPHSPRCFPYCLATSCWSAGSGPHRIAFVLSFASLILFEIALRKVRKFRPWRARPVLAWSLVHLALVPLVGVLGLRYLERIEESPVVRVSAGVTRGGSDREEEVRFYLADADSKGERYEFGKPAIGVVGGWRVPDHAFREGMAAVYVPETPIGLGASDRLVVRLRGQGRGHARVSVSPLAFDDLRRAIVDGALAPALRSGPGSRTPERASAPMAAYLKAYGPDPAALEAYHRLVLDRLECRDGRASTMITEARPPAVTRVLPRGNWQDESGEVVTPGVPGFLPQPPGAGSRRLDRLDLARWLTSPDNPLTARVFANRLWKQFLGNGLSGAMEDVGAQGESPSHPELLDWLACEFRDGGWDVKALVKTIVMSAAYRQDSRPGPGLRDSDPNNRLLASQNPRRLEAELVRDNALTIAGLLNRDLGGPSIRPYQPAGYYANLQFPDRVYRVQFDDRQYRRGVYVHAQRTFPHPMLTNFDAPSREECTAGRNVANTPQQALTLLNDPTFVEAARALAGSILAEAGLTDGGRLDLLFERALARPPKDEERASLLAFLDRRRAEARDHPEEASKLLKVGMAPNPAAAAPEEMAAWTEACRVVLNLHETITRY